VGAGERGAGDEVLAHRREAADQHRLKADFADQFARELDRALVVAGEDSLDEVSTSAPTRIFEINGTEITSYTIEPRDLGIEPSDGVAVAAGGTPEQNAALTRAVLAGEGGPARDLALANAGAAIYAAKAAASLREAVALAGEAVDKGRASETLERFIAATHEGAR